MQFTAANSRQMSLHIFTGCTIGTHYCVLICVCLWNSHRQAVKLSLSCLKRFCIIWVNCKAFVTRFFFYFYIIIFYIFKPLRLPSPNSFFFPIFIYTASWKIITYPMYIYVNAYIYPGTMCVLKNLKMIEKWLIAVGSSSAVSCCHSFSRRCYCGKCRKCSPVNLTMHTHTHTHSGGVC